MSEESILVLTDWRCLDLGNRTAPCSRCLQDFQTMPEHSERQGAETRPLISPSQRDAAPLSVLSHPNYTASLLLSLQALSPASRGGSQPRSPAARSWSLQGPQGFPLPPRRPPSLPKGQTGASGTLCHPDRHHRDQHCHLQHEQPFSGPPLHSLLCPPGILLSQKPTRMTPAPPSDLCSIFCNPPPRKCLLILKR